MNARQETIINILRKEYGKARIALKYSSAWELLVAVILSAQCTDKTVNKVTSTLFIKYPTLDSYINANEVEFQNDIRQTGFFRVKGSNILKSARIIKEKFNGNVPNTMNDLLTLPGVARKTANVVLGNAYGVVAGMATDTHIIRISQRLGLVDLNKIGGKKKAVFIKDGIETIDFIKDADPVIIEKELMLSVPYVFWFSLTYQIIDHGRNICKAQSPNCIECPLNQLCRASRV